jgi:hypothetical protein
MLLLFNFIYVNNSIIPVSFHAARRSYENIKKLDLKMIDKILIILAFFKMQFILRLARKFLIFFDSHCNFLVFFFFEPFQPDF